MSGKKSFIDNIVDYFTGVKYIPAEITRPVEQVERTPVDFSDVFNYTISEDGQAIENSHMLDLVKQKDYQRIPTHHAFNDKTFFPSNDSQKKWLQTQLGLSDGELVQDSLTTLQKCSIGSFLGMAIGDALGAPLEFEHVRYNDKDRLIHGMSHTDLRGRFCLAAGQWTDDASMGLCIADSLLCNKKEFKPADMKLRFGAWLWFGHNTCFNYVEDNLRGSVGCGGNISMSMMKFIGCGEIYTRAGDSQTSGCGSIMRLAAIPICFNDDLEKAMQNARNSSLLTHQGEEAAECCRLLAFIVIKMIKHNEKNNVFNAKSVLEDLSEFSSSEDSVNCLAGSKQEEGDDVNRNWEWRKDVYLFSEQRAKSNPGYIGSYAMDNLCMALHCVWTTDCFSEALLKCANQCGDADSVAAVAGQIAGACYGVQSIPKDWIQKVQNWDRQGEICLRAYLLCTDEEVGSQSD